MIALLQFLDRWIERFSRYALVFLVLFILLMGMSNIVFRWFSYPVNWIEPLIRHLVFVSAFLGGVLATGKRAHVGIDIVGKYLEVKQMSRASKLIRSLVALVSCAVLLWLTFTSFAYVSLEAQHGKELFLGVHAKYVAAVIPTGFLLIAYRFLVVFFETLKEES